MTENDIMGFPISCFFQIFSKFMTIFLLLLKRKEKKKHPNNGKELPKLVCGLKRRVVIESANGFSSGGWGKTHKPTRLCYS